MSAPTKSVRIIVLAAFMFSTLMYGAIVLILPHRESTVPPGSVENVRSICYTVAIAGLLTATYWTFAKLPAAPDSARFLTDMIVAVALTEICSIAGMVLFFTTHKASEFWPFAIATLLVQALFILPRALQRD